MTQATTKAGLFRPAVVQYGCYVPPATRSDFGSTEDLAGSPHQQRCNTDEDDNAENRARSVHHNRERSAVDHEATGMQIVHDRELLQGLRKEEIEGFKADDDRRYYGVTKPQASEGEDSP